MTARPDPDARPGPLVALRARLSGGVLPAARRCVDEDWRPRPGAVETEEIATKLETLYGVRHRGLRPDRAQSAIDGIARHLAGDRHALLAALFAPEHMLDDTPRVGRQTPPGSADGATPRTGVFPPGTDLFHHWLGLCWMAEAAWIAVTGGVAGDGFAPGDRELLYPLAARMRFLALSEPMRHRAEAGSPWLPSVGSGIPGYGVYHLAFGAQSWNDLVGRCRQARRAWLACLDSFQTHPYLATATSTEFEAELTAVAFRSGRGRPLTISTLPPVEPGRPTADDADVLGQVASRHLLPRFWLAAVVRTALWSADARRSAARIAVGGLVLAAAAGAFGCAVAFHPHRAAALAAATYALLLSGTVTFGTPWAALWLLRIPAAAAIGAFTLVTFLPDGWLAAPVPHWLTAGGALLAAGYGYLLIEARHHGVSSGRALLRSAGVTIVGLGHAALVTLLALVAVAPAVTPGLGALWHHPGGHRHAATILLVSTAWCFTTGVFTQILWDDRPITASLAHTTWRADGRL